MTTEVNGECCSPRATTSHPSSSSSAGDEVAIHKNSRHLWRAHAKAPPPIDTSCTERYRAQNARSPTSSISATSSAVSSPLLIDSLEMRRCRRNTLQTNNTDVFSTVSGGAPAFPLMSLVKCRLTKTFFTVPRKCTRCHKMIVLTAGYMCQYCSYRCHRKCTAVGSSCGSSNDLNSPTGSIDGPSEPRQMTRVCSLSRMPATQREADSSSDAWQQLMADNNLTSAHQFYPQQWLPFQWQRTPSNSELPKQESPTSGAEPESGVSDPLGSRESVHTLKSEEPASPTQICVRVTDYDLNNRPACSARRRTSSESQRQDTLKAAGSQDEEAATPGSTSDNDNQSMMHRLMGRLWPWGQQSSTESTTPTPQDIIVNIQQKQQYTSKRSSHVDNFNKELLEQVLQQQKQSTTSSAAEGSLTDSAISSFTGTGSGAASIGGLGSMLTRRLAWVRHMVGDRGAHSQDCMTPALHHTDVSFRRRLATDSPTSSIERRHVSESGNERGPWPMTNGTSLGKLHATQLISTSWPLIGMHLNYDDVFEDEHSASETLTAPELSAKQYFLRRLNGVSTDSAGADTTAPSGKQPVQQRDSFRDLTEWTIDYNDLCVGEIVREGRMVRTYRGKWHGDVMIHHYTSNHLERFLRDVHTLSKIRHDNIALFVGACMQPPNLCVITCIGRGESLFERIHLRGPALAHQQKMQIATQVAQGIGYLHARKIVLRCLNSKSIFLDSKVKICTVDYGGEAVRSKERALITRNRLAYWSPELVRSLRVESNHIRADPRYQTKQSDVTLLFEMLSSSYPFAEHPLATVIYLVGHGVRHTCKTLRCIDVARYLIEDCWQADPAYRPTFHDILRKLQQTTQMHKRHSSSDPQAINRIGI